MKRSTLLTLLAVPLLGCPPESTAEDATDTAGTTSDADVVESDSTSADATDTTATDTVEAALACYAGQGACVPGEGQCDANERCDTSNPGAFACSSGAMATRMVGELCSLDADCRDGAICDPAAEICRSLCCDDSDCGDHQTCAPADGNFKVCVPAAPTWSYCYHNQGECTPQGPGRPGECGAGAACAFVDGGFECSSNPSPMAELGAQCSDTAGPACQDGLYCSPDSHTCVKMCCDPGQCDIEEVCTRLDAGLSVCAPDVPIDPGDHLECYSGKGACDPGQDQCGEGGGCDFSGTNFQCFNDPPATATKGEACDLQNGPACLDGLTCSVIDFTCVALCCDESDCGANEKCQPTGVGHAICLPDAGPSGSCYDGVGTCAPGHGDCGEGGHCDFANESLGWQCFTTPAPTAQLGEACNKTAGPDCVDGLTCSILTNTCVQVCCEDDDCTGDNDECVSMVSGKLAICQEKQVNTGDGLQCYEGHGNCIPGAGQCGTNAQCDWGNSSIGTQCFSQPPATAELGASCNLNVGPACKDGLSCSPQGKCLAICCEQSDCEAGGGTCTAVDGFFKVCL
ncbi:MAG: hypothetical protein EP329_07060 [Deltaproteobacteria bacterium]|nr:MAG: hypothetical protein EP329_07060 [Deltaproteobacteria bacterium]